MSISSELLIVGSELVSGDKLDTNGQWLCQRLAECGLPVRFSTLLGDEPEDNLLAFRAASARSRVVVTSGGLGPTQDDLTREILAKIAGEPLEIDETSLASIQALFARRQRPMPDRNRIQAMLPRSAEALPNPIGTAPGLWMRVGNAWFACLPGVPSELKRMFQEQVLPRLHREGLVGGAVVHRVINLFGLGEAEVEAQALDLTARGHDPEVGITASDATISFRIRGTGPNAEAALRSTDETARIVRERFGILVLGEGSVDVPQATIDVLRQAGKTIAVAESCTGGLIAARLTSVPGSSTVFRGGVVSYATDLKTTIVGVDPDLIERHGVVSGPVAEAMAAGVRDRLQADIGIGVTGVAGPDGGTEETPVGCVYLGLAFNGRTWSKRLNLGAEQPRTVIQSRASKHAMNWARLLVLRGGDPG